jgi:hypothetical protein
MGVKSRTEAKPAPKNRARAEAAAWEKHRSAEGVGKRPMGPHLGASQQADVLQQLLHDDEALWGRGCVGWGATWAGGPHRRRSPRGVGAAGAPALERRAMILAPKP